MVTVIPPWYVHMFWLFVTKTYQTRQSECVVSTDGATAHTARNLKDVLRELFSVPLIFLHDDMQWPTLSPVSYTHLDVYKRQGLTYAIGVIHKQSDMATELQNSFTILDKIHFSLDKIKLENFYILNLLIMFFVYMILKVS